MPLILTVPPEGTYTQAELAFIELSPDNLWPENQDSNFGQFRAVLCEIVQENIDFLTTLNLEAFFLSASRYLDLWEEQMGLPASPEGKSDAQRRSAIAIRNEYGVFTRARRARAIESFITATFGVAPSFTPDGIELTAGGIPLFSGITSLDNTYLVVEDVEDFSYKVYVLDALGVDEDGLERELLRLTPAHLSFTVDYVDTLSYSEYVLDGGPRGFWPLGASSVADLSGFSHPLTHNNGPITGEPGILEADDDLSVRYRSTTDDYSQSTSGVMTNAQAAYSIECWVKPVTFNASFDFGIAVNLNDSYIRMLGSSHVFGTQGGAGIPKNVSGTTVAELGKLYHLAATYDGTNLRLYVNGALEGTVAMSGTIDMSGSVFIGDFQGGAFEFGGNVSKVAVYNRALSLSEIQFRYMLGATKR